MTWTYDKTESSYFAVFPQSKVKIVVEGDEFALNDDGAEIAGGEFLPLLEGKYYHFELFGDKNARLSGKSSFVRKAARHGSIAPGTAVGYGRLYLEGAEDPSQGLGLEVASEVISYKKDYQDLLKQLTEEIADLQMQCSSCVQGLVKSDARRRAKNDVQQFFFLLGLVGNAGFESAVRQIVERPYVQLTSVEDETDVRRAARLGRHELLQIASAARRMDLPSCLCGGCAGLRTIPEHVVATRRTECVDTLENRFVKYALGFFLNRLRMFEGILKSRKKDGSAISVEVDLKAVTRMLSRWLAHAFFRDIGPLERMPTSSVVLQRREGYREILRKWLQFQSGTQLAWKPGEDIYAANQRKMSTLYEYWCFFRLLRIVCRIFDVNTSEVARKMIGKGADGLSLVLKAGNTLTLEGMFDSGRVGARYRRLAVEYSYNRTFSGKNREQSWTLPMRPDYTLAFRPLGMRVEEAIANDLVTYVHFDAKYKAQDIVSSLKQIGTSVEEDDKSMDTDDESAETKRDVKRVDILKMHAYRDAIRRTGGAYVLYPGTEAKIDRENGEILPGLGAFQMSPSHDSSEKIAGFLMDVARHLCDRVTRWENYSYRAYQIYKEQGREDWQKRTELVRAHTVEGDDRELDEKTGVRQDFQERAVARFADPNRYFSHPLGEPRYGQVKWAYFKNLCVVPSKKFNKPDPRQIAFITVPWEPPLVFIVQRYVDEYQGAIIQGAYPDCPVCLKQDEEYHLWEVRIVDVDALEAYMRKQGDLL